MQSNFDHDALAVRRLVASSTPRSLYQHRLAKRKRFPWLQDAILIIALVAWVSGLLWVLNLWLTRPI